VAMTQYLNHTPIILSELR